MRLKNLIRSARAVLAAAVMCDMRFISWDFYAIRLCQFK